MSRPRDLPDEAYRVRIQSRTELNADGCWIYQGHKNGFGYAQVFCRGERWMVHRLAYTLWKGPIPPKMQVCHSCDTPSCVNPEHLWLGTNLDNQRDSIRKRRHANAAKTHCPAGHDYAVDGYAKKDGRRACSACERLRWGRPAKAPSNARKTCCVHGHPLAGDNLYVTPGDGRRQCRICRNEGQVRRRERIQATTPSRTESKP